MTFPCPCGGLAWTKADLLATGDEMDRHLADYLSEETAYCPDEDDVLLPEETRTYRSWWRRRIHRLRLKLPHRRHAMDELVP